jgi:hypothetical protein
MSSIRQIEANQRNARLSTGPVTKEGKKRSRQNAVRHGLTAETVITALEDADDYRAFEMAVTADYDAQTAVERELVLKLAGLLWRLRRASAIETGLFELQAQHLFHVRKPNDGRDFQDSIRRMRRTDTQSDGDTWCDRVEQCEIRTVEPSSIAQSDQDAAGDLTRSFVRLINLPSCPLDRLSRYEARLWRQACQIMFTLACLDSHKPWERRRSRRTEF